MVKALRILQLIPRFPFPLDDGGKIGIANIFMEFSKQGNDVYLFSLGDELIPEEHINLAKNYGKVEVFEHNTENSIARILYAFFTNTSVYLNKHFENNILNRLDELVSKNDFDIIHADHTCMAPLALYLKDKYRIPCGLRLHNIEWIIWKRYYDILKASSPKRIFLSQQYKVLKHKETDIIANMDINFAITDKDKQRALELSTDANVTIASAGVNPDEWKPDDNIKRNKFELVLATTFRWIHNINAINWFITNVLSELKEKYPKITLTLVGKNPPKWFDNYRNLGVNVVGYVKKVQPYYNRANLNISPLFVGGGIRIKILEAMSMKLPVLASPIAAEGINASEYDGLFISESKKDFITNISKLIENSSLRTSSGESARKFVMENYHWTNNVKIMLDHYENLL